jgi:hypothetical protein
MLKYDDLTWKANKNNYPMWKSMADAGYSNIVYGEYALVGSYDAQELYDYMTEFPSTKAFLLKADYQDLGVSVVNGELAGCPVQLIVQQMAGYIPPSYSADLISGWETSLNQLRNIQPSWQRLTTYPLYNNHKAEVDRINQIISERISMIDAVVTRMKANQWLTTEQNEYTKTTDKALYDEQESLAKKLNSY